ncbi:transcriptional regulator, AraC family [Arcobacter nitrofigilis DSM 7299]|uniref:Transcriptional regulator, AraC family n=1 Tax=Arcobacter nitrofigilis (strain ATCC 33309 / DSM 7299 / CCUG 15893 / LMG 7604 / NCTC 12251 / CI) TaxID=572480 RepID=D5V4W7_ARCNC|nr:AraC family transcriptional regulator [Arcobacter nitrofigilis]ADG91929.1 transcriptional regulator, AraC family [Arcobacter nitrofigilis DSM 7299]
MKKNTFTKIFKDEKIPYLELRYTNSNKHYKKHFHDTFSLGINEQGVSIYTNNDKSYTLDENMLSIVNPYAVHSCNACSEVLNIYYMLYLDISWCKEVQKSIDDKVNEFTNIPLDILEDKVFYDEYLTLCKFLFSDNHISDKEDILIDFFIKFFSLFLDKTEDANTNKEFDKIVFFLEKNYKENISIKELSKFFNLNPYYIIRLFKSKINLTPHAFLINLKINKAKELLQQGHSISDTALECGFFDQSHFHKNFVKIVATTPKEYKLNFVQ